MSKPEFSASDLDTILDALDEFERKDLESLPSVERMLKILPESRCVEHHEAYAEFRNELAKQEGKMKKQKKMARERITLLKAKIIMMQQDQGIDELMEEASKPIQEEN